MEITLELIVKGLLSEAGRPTRPREAERAVPKCPGLYSIVIDDPAILPAPFGQHLRNRATPLIYLGKASSNLRDRLVWQDLRHRNPSSFFRSLGTVLGFLPPKASLAGKERYNYQFSKRDTACIIEWVNDHLLVRWVEMPERLADEFEADCIKILRPLLNLKRRSRNQKGYRRKINTAFAQFGRSVVSS